MSMSIGSKEPAPAPVAVTPPSAHVNSLTTRSAWDAARAACQHDPGAYHGDIACRELHWFEPSVGEHGAWIRFEPATGMWRGFDARTLQPVQPALPAQYRPWHTALDSSEAPFYRWFGGALTNACFNEIDRHVLDGHGAEA
ncbi:MAG: acetyl-coenzyme A synthetase N-terminal domain-containing protein, partial [Steroidobacteraceae bacterium]